MAAKLLHSLADDNPDLHKPIAPSTNVFQPLDRQHVIAGGRGTATVGHSLRRLSPGHPQISSSTLKRESNYAHPRSALTHEKHSNKNMLEKQRVPSVSSRIMFPETPSRNSSTSLRNSSPQVSRQSIDLRDFVKDSIHIEAQGLSDHVGKYRDSSRPKSKTTNDGSQRTPVDLKESLSVLAKLQEAPLKYQNEPRHLLRSSSYHSKDGSSFSVPKGAPRFSYDGRETKDSPFDFFQDVSKSALPRLSLDSRDLNWDSKSNLFLKCTLKDDSDDFDGQAQSLKQIPGNQARPPSLVAKLMGLETLPHNVCSCRRYRDEGFVDISKPYAKTGSISDQQSSSSKNLWKEPNSPRSMKPMSKFEPAPWKPVDGTRSFQKPRSPKTPSKIPTTFPSVYSEIEKRLKDLEFGRSGKDLRALKQILESVQANGFLDSQKDEERSLNSNDYESPIVIMKPAKLVESSHAPAASVISPDNFVDYRKVITGAKMGKDLNCKFGQRNNALNFVNIKDDRTLRNAHSSTRSQPFTTDRKSSGSISPRMQQNKLDLERRSQPSTPPDSSKSRRQSDKLQAESSSPGARRLRHLNSSGVNVESRSFNNCENESIVLSSKRTVLAISERSLPCMRASEHVLCGLAEKKTLALSEEESAELGFVPLEYSSPVSVLDNIDYPDNSPPFVKYIAKPLRVDASLDTERTSNGTQGASIDSCVPNSQESCSTYEINRKKLEKVDNLVQKLRRLNSSHDEARNDYIASLCENADPDHRYISEILLASGLLLRELGSSLTHFQFHPSGQPINPELFLVLEQTKARTLSQEESETTTQLIMKEKSHRRLVFDTVNEILARKLALPAGPFPEPLSKKGSNGQKFLKELCCEIEGLRAKNLECSSEEDERWKNILCKDVMLQTESWMSLDGEFSGAVLDIEQLIFKDLVDEFVVGKSAGLRTKTHKSKLFAM